MLLKKIVKLLIPGCELSRKIYRRYSRARYFYKHNWDIVSNIITYNTYKKFHCFISPKAEIEADINFPHPIGIVIGEGAKIGKNCTIYQNVTIGRKNKDLPEYPTIKDNVVIYCNSTIIGNIEIGENSIIGCNTVVLSSVNSNSKCVGVVK